MRDAILPGNPRGRPVGRRRLRNRFVRRANASTFLVEIGIALVCERQGARHRLSRGKITREGDSSDRKNNRDDRRQAIAPSDRASKSQQRRAGRRCRTHARYSLEERTPKHAPPEFSNIARESHASKQSALKNSRPGAVKKIAGGECGSARFAWPASARARQLRLRNWLCARLNLTERPTA